MRKLLIMSISIASIRKDYRRHSLDETNVDPDPLIQFRIWFEEAVRSEVDEVNAMTLATHDATGIPDARIVLLKGLDKKGFVFFTNYCSVKGKQLEKYPGAALVFFWKELERQVRVRGTVSKIAASESDEYFHSRPEGSRIGAWASPQSEVIANRKLLEDYVAGKEKLFAGKDIPRPEFWGGYRVVPASVEFWQGRENRLHDRIRYIFENNQWRLERLAP